MLMLDANDYVSGLCGITPFYTITTLQPALAVNGAGTGDVVIPILQLSDFRFYGRRALACAVSIAGAGKPCFVGGEFSGVGHSGISAVTSL